MHIAYRLSAIGDNYYFFYSGLGDSACIHKTHSFTGTERGRELPREVKIIFNM